MEEEDNRKRVQKQSKSESQHPFDGPPTSSRRSTGMHPPVQVLQSVSIGTEYLHHIPNTPKGA